MYNKNLVINREMMSRKYMVELETIKQLLDEYYKSNSLDKQTNETIKNKIKELIIFAHEDTALKETDKQTVISTALTLLAENTGCVEDCEIAETIFRDLFNKRKIISQKEINNFYENSPVNRWL